MSTIVLNGRELSQTLLKEQEIKVEGLLRQKGRPPGLAVVLVGRDVASESYVRNKRGACSKVGIHAPEINLPETTSQQELESIIDRLNQDPAIDGILVQLPLPSSFQKEAILYRIDPAKDVDGFHPVNVGKLVIGLDTLAPCTPTGIMTLLDRHHIPVSGKNAVVLGRSLIVGKPMALLLMNRDATVTVCHSRTSNLIGETRRADIVVAAMGKPLMVNADFIKPGAVVIDVGISRNAEGKLVGDVDYASVAPIASAITPVPGGVGPMTIATLLDNTIRAFCLREGISLQPTRTAS
ncbi:MAG: bifunctional methylenetetrahydrofolate dehydrogenase/methenyltetrahydrofolate cyclohydrolase FolD [Leptospirales bacterium]